MSGSNSTKMKKFYIWEKESNALLSSVSLAPGTAEYAALLPDDAAGTEDNPTDAVVSNSTVTDVKIFCSVCCIDLEDRKEQVQHYTTEYHKDNQKRVLKGLSCLTVEEYKENIANKAEESSLSGSEDDESFSDTDSTAEEDKDADVTQSPRMGRKPRLFFMTPSKLVLSIYRSLLLHNKAELESAPSLCRAAQQLPTQLHWSIILQSGGHFAAAVFQGSSVLVHKTFHSYTVRAGQGGSQGSYDNRSATSHPRSAGASLRRYNEASHNMHIQEILESWKDHLSASELVFLRVSRHSQAAVFGRTLTAKDPRLRTVPFPTRKPTYAEVKRVHRLLAEVKLHGSEEEFLEESIAEGVTCIRVQQQQRARSSPAADARHKGRKTRHARQQEDGYQSSSSSSSSAMEQPESSRRGGSSSTGDLASSEAADPAAVAVEEEQQVEQADRSAPAAKKKKRKKNNKDVQKTANGSSLNLSTQEVLEDHQKSCSLESIRVALFTACRGGDLARLQTLHQYCADGRTTPQVYDLGVGVKQCVERYCGQFSLLQLRLGNVLKTALHVASENGHKDLVRWILETGECDPSTHDARGRAPYTYSNSNTIKLVYRQYREQQPHACDYTKSSIPAPLTKEEEIVANEKKKAQKLAKKAKQKEKKLKQEELLKEQKERERYLALDDREKRALAAERRLLALHQTPSVGATTTAAASRPVFLRCFQCANDISGLVPFEYSDNKFCSTACVKLHRVESKAGPYNHR